MRTILFALLILSVFPACTKTEETSQSESKSDDGGGGGGGGGGGSSACTWSTVDDYKHDTTSTYNLAMDIAEAKDGSLITVGYGYDNSSAFHAITRRSTDGGTNWITVDDFTSGGSGVANGVCVAPSGTVYVVGGKGATLGLVVRKSSDHGATWSDAYTTMTLNDGTENHDTLQGHRCSIDAQGRVYFNVNSTGQTSGVYKVLTLKGDDSSFAPTIVNTTLVDPATGTIAVDTATDSSGNVFTAVYGGDMNSLIHWRVEKSADHGANWSVVDDIVGIDSSSQYAQPLGLTTSSSGKVVAVGVAYDSTGANSYWHVRQSTDYGANWSTLDSFSLLPTLGSTWASSAAFDASGKLFVNGTIDDGTGNFFWGLRSTIDNGTNWSTKALDQLNYMPYKMLIDSQGRMWSVGNFIDSGNYRWFVKRCQ